MVGTTPEPLTGVIDHLLADAGRLADELEQGMVVEGEGRTVGREASGEVAQRLRRSVVRPLRNARAALTCDRSTLEEPAAHEADGNRQASRRPEAPGTGVGDASDRIFGLALRTTEARLLAGAPVDLQEAAAALDDLAFRTAPTTGPDRAAERLARLGELVRSLSPAIVPLPNGPLLVTNVDTLRNWLGEPLPAYPQLALCRCGGSSMKPLCDGTHVDNHFTDAKDPKRVPDRLDTYPGPPITITDNRGTCAHSGFCTDRLPGVFRVDGEPFVAVNGGDAEGIARAVRACPSGALGFPTPYEGSQDLAHSAREPSIEVSKDGPYRISGGIALIDASGEQVTRNQGANTARYSLCRCGHSQNKPFCSGMHWYVGFVDPEAPGQSQTPASSAEPVVDIAIPGAGESVSFDEHIKPLFRAKDRQSMQFAFDLWSYDDVCANAGAIADQVRSGSMPCDGSWPAEWVDVFERWRATGMQQSASSPPAATATSDGTSPNDNAASEAVEAIQGRLGHVLAVRSSTPVEERSIVIEHREPLIYMLCAAAELEHALMCEYLFAAFSLKRSVDEGLTEEQLAMVERWRSSILMVAKQEMLHLAINCNLVTSLGASPHLSRPNLPQPAKHYPGGVRLALLPFGEQALRHFMFLERPEGMDIDDAEGLDAVDCAVPVMGPEEIAPHLQEFQTVGHLYRSIEAGFRNLAEKMGEARVFLGPRDAQAHGELFGWKQLAPISTVDEAVRAIEAIVEQGEGPRGDWRRAHFGRFLSVLEEYLDLMEKNPGLEVTRPVLPVLVRPPESGEQAEIITDPATARVADLCNVAYEVLLQLFYRLLCHVDESEEQIKTLADVGVGMMFDVIEPLADILTTLPVGPEHPGKTAGATFELFYQPDYLLPHRKAAWLLMAEHLEDAAVLTDAEAKRDTRFQPVAQALRAHADVLQANAR